MLNRNLPHSRGKAPRSVVAVAQIQSGELQLKEFDYSDIGAILDAPGAVPEVIKSLIFPTPRCPEKPPSSQPPKWRSYFFGAWNSPMTAPVGS